MGRDELKRLIAAIALIGALAGCAGVDYVLDNYSGIKPINYQSAALGKGFRIFDKPAENKLMITPTIGQALGEGMAKGLVGSGVGAPEIVFENGALEWLASTGRSCVATRTYLLIETQWEVLYNCQVNAVPSAAPAIAEATIPTAQPPQTVPASVTKPKRLPDPPRNGLDM